MTSRSGAVPVLMFAQLGLAVLALALPEAGCAAVKFTRVGTIPGIGGPVEGVVRTSDWTLHLVYPASSSGTFGLTSTTISPAGAIGASTSALGSDWGVTPPGLVMLPNGSLEAIFGAISPSTYSPANANGIWGINSSDGGQTWSQPAGCPERADARGSVLQRRDHGAGGSSGKVKLTASAPAYQVLTKKLKL
jgi:hypothetical protein